MSKKVLWLCSWYPNENDKFRGDFIQRQARAASQYCCIDVLHVVVGSNEKVTTQRVNKNLTETIIYIKKKNKLLDFLKAKEVSFNFFQKQKYDVVHVQIPIPMGIIALDLQKKFKVPFVVSEHYGIYNSIVDDKYATRSLLFRYFTKQTFARAKTLITVSESLGEDINREVLHKKYDVIPNVVDTNLFHFDKSHANKKFQFIHVSNMASMKNVEGILHAVKQLAEMRNDFEVHLVGANPSELIQQAKNLNMFNSTVFFHPEMSYEAVADFVKKSDAGLLFSTSESQSCVVLEWLCAGLPVITSAVGGVKELIQEENGILVESGNIHQLVEAMKLMIDTYSDFNQNEISTKAITNYSYENVGKKIASIYERI